MNREFRIVPGAEVRLRKDGKGIEGYAAVFGKRSLNLGGFKETVRAGCFSRAVKEDQDVFGMFNHDANLVLGRTSARTMRIAEDSQGLHYDIDVADTTVGRDVHKHIERGDITGCSFSFSIPDKEKGQRFEKGADDDGSAILMRDLLDVDLYDVGPVTMPAYPDTLVSARSFFPNVPVELRGYLIRSGSVKTKSVAGEDLPASAFAYVGDPEDTSTWKLPIKFSTDEKTASHIRNAIARFDQTDGIPASEKSKVWDKIMAAAKAHSIDVSADDSKRALTSRRTFGCACDCPDCEAGNCLGCSASCADANCDHDGTRSAKVASDKLEFEDLMRRVEIERLS
jgi:hypothetical protein